MKIYLSFVGYLILIHFFVHSSTSGEIHFDPLEMVENSVDFHLKPPITFKQLTFIRFKKAG